MINDKYSIRSKTLVGVFLSAALMSLLANAVGAQVNKPPDHEAWADVEDAARIEAETAQLNLIVKGLAAIYAKAQRQHMEVADKRIYIEVKGPRLDAQFRNTREMLDGEFRAEYDSLTGEVRFFHDI